MAVRDGLHQGPPISCTHSNITFQILHSYYLILLILVFSTSNVLVGAKSLILSSRCSRYIYIVAAYWHRANDNLQAGFLRSSCFCLTVSCSMLGFESHGSKSLWWLPSYFKEWKDSVVCLTTRWGFQQNELLYAIDFTILTYSILLHPVLQCRFACWYLSCDTLECLEDIMERLLLATWRLHSIVSFSESMWYVFQLDSIHPRESDSRRWPYI